jgi:predicted transposase YdaD
VGKNYDSTFKSLADDDPRGLLFLFSGIPLTADVVIEPLPREVTAPALQVDHIYRIKTADRQWIWHIEVQTHYKSDLPERILQYDLLLAVKYPGEEIRSTLVLLVERTTPRSVQAEIEADLGGLRVRAEFQVIRMWELDPKPVIESGRPDLLPWVGLMQSSPAEFLTALHRVGMSGDPKLRAQIVLLGGLRYDKQGIEAVLRRIGDMFITADILRESSVTKDFIRELEENAIASGTARGRVEEARRLIRTLVALRFPSLGDLPQLDRVADAGRLEELMRDLILADSLEPAAAAVARIPD